MEYTYGTFYDVLTFTELTPQNVVRCLDGYLDTIVEVDNYIVEELNKYIEYAVSIDDKELTLFIIHRINHFLLGH